MKRKKANRRRVEKGLFRQEGYYHIRFRCNGRTVCKNAGRDLKRARQLLYQLRDRARLGQLGILDNDLSLVLLKQEFLEYAGQTCHVSTVTGYEFALKPVFEFLRVETVGRLRSDTVVAYRKRRLGQGVSPKRVNSEVGALKRVLNYGVEAGLIERNPLQNLSRLKTEPTVQRVLTREEFERLLNHTHSTGGRGPKQVPCSARDIWLLFGETGMRRGELVHLTWSDVDFDDNRIHVCEHTKETHGHAWAPKTRSSVRWIPMSDRVRAMLLRRHAEAQSDSQFVFHTRRGRTVTNNLRRQLRSCLRNARIPGKGICNHTFRRSFITWLLDARANVKSVQAIVGHASASMTLDVYAQATSQGVEETITLLNGVEKVLEKGAQAEADLQSDAA